MVTSIVPGSTSANVLGVDQRLNRSGSTISRQSDTPANNDKVELSASALAVTRDSVRYGVGQVQEALALGSEAQSMLVQVQGCARDGSQADLDALLQSFMQRTAAAIDRGAKLVSGEDVSVQAEPGAPGVTIAGVDLRLKDDPGAGDLISVPANADVSDPGLAAAAQKSLEALQAAMTKLVDSARSLEAHQGFLGAAEGASSVRDLDADGARLLALQVRQGLQSLGSGIANVEPQAVLALFKAQTA